MKVTLDQEIFKWLSGNGVLNLKAPFNQLKSNGKLELDEQMSKLFMNGMKMGEMVNRMLESRHISIPSLMDSMKNQNTPGVKLFNWNLLQDAFQKMNLPLDNDIKGLIVQGDCEMINELLKDVYQFDMQTQKKMSRSSVRSSGQSFESRKPPSRVISRLPNTHYEKANQEEVIVDDVDNRQPLTDCKSLADYLINGLSRHLALQPQQAATLLSNGYKFLAHLVVKGVKGEFEPIINWLSEVYATLQRVFQFFEEHDSNVHMFLSAIKPGLLSKDQEVTLWSLRILGRAFFELSEMEMHQVGYEWFTRENGGLAATFMCMQRHPQLIQQICELYGQVARYNINDFFTVQFKKQLADKCVDMFNQLIEGLHSQKSLKEELVEAGVIQYWASQAIKLADQDAMDVRIQGLKYLTNNWMLYPIQFEEDQNMPTQFLFLMKKSSRDSQNVLKFFALNNLFRLLEQLANDRNPFAAVLYKKLTFSLIENYAELEIRDFMIQNFMYIIQRFSTIPIDILLEPFIKQVQMNDSSVNLPDMLLFKFIVGHPKMKVRLAILLLDLLSKIYLNQVAMSQLALPPMQMLMARFIESDLLKEYAFKLAKISMALHYASLKSKKQHTRINDLSILSALQSQNNDQEILQMQKRSQIIELVKFIINMQQSELNDQIKPLLCHFYLELQALQIKDKGVITLLNLFGNPEQIMREIKQQWDQERQEQEEIMRRSQIMIDNEFNEPSQGGSPSRKSEQSSAADPFTELRQREITEEKQFLQQHGIGFKKRVVELEKGKQLPAPGKKKPPAQIDPKVLENIASIKMKKEEDLLQKQVAEEEKRKRIQMLAKKAQQEIQKRNTKQDKSDQIELIDMDEQEQMDQESMLISTKRHQKALKYLFQKYSNTTNQVGKKQYFNELQDQFEVIQYTDLIRMFKDYQVAITKEELLAIVKRYGSSGDHNNLDFQNFERLFAQVALRTEKAVYQRHLAGNSFDQMIFNFGQLAKSKNENHLIFTDPDNIAMDPDRDLIKQINYQLEQNMDVQIPPKFKKAAERQFHLKSAYKPNVLLGLPQAWLDCHEIVNSMIHETFKVSIMEPIVDIRLVTKIKPKLNQEPAQVASKNKDQQSKKVLNKAIEDKIQKQQEEEQKKLEAEEKRKKHQEKLKQEYLRKKKEKDEEELNKKQEERQKLIDQGEREKRQQEIIKKEAEDKRQKLREYREQQAEQQKVKEQQNIELQKQKLEQDKKQREEFNKKQKVEVKKVIESKQKAFKEKEEQEKQKEQQKQDELKEWKNNVETMLKEEQEIRQQEKQTQLNILQLYQDGNIQQLFRQYEKPLQIIYHAFQEYTEFKIENIDVEKDLLQLKGFTNFASQFNIYPSIITPDDAQLIFRSLRREREAQQQQLNDKQGFSTPATSGMSYKEFEQGLLRIAIKGQKYFDLLTDKYDKNMKTIDMLALKKDQAASHQKGPLEKREDLYQQVDQTSVRTLQGLFYFLDIPEDKSELQSKLRALKLEYQKVTASRDKKNVLTQKLGEDVAVKGARRNVSMNKDKSKERSQDKKLPNKQSTRNQSANQRLVSAKSKQDKLEAIDKSSLMKQSVNKMEAIGPDGKKENWEINKDK